MPEQSGFFSKLLARRIPQFLGIFLAGSWTALEFTQWAVERYSLSPNWEEVLVVFLLLCLPLVLVSAWHHGAPGKQRWSLFEKIFLPAYLLLIPLTLHHNYKDVDLGKTLETVVVKDEAGNTHQREVVKSQFIKPIIIYPFQNKTNDSQHDILAGITSKVLNRDLKQNIFYSSPDMEWLSESIKSDNQSFRKLPLSYQINQAKERARKYLLTGELLQTTPSYSIKVSLYNMKNGRKETEFVAESSNYFDTIDQLTIEINDHFQTGNDYTDLPIEDLFTNNWDAFNDYAQGTLLVNYGDKPQDSEALFLSAIEKDESFSVAAASLVQFYSKQNKINTAKKYVQLAQQHQGYRLTERERFPINSSAYYLNQQPQKAFGVLEQWVALYPTDTYAYLLKAQSLQFNQGNHQEAIKNLKKVIELDPSQHALWDAIGDMYNNAGEYEKALTAYENYSEKNSSNPIAYKNLGDLYKKTGQYDSVINNYQAALGLEPNNPSVLAQLADAYARIGLFEDAESTYLLAIENSNTTNMLVNNNGRIAQFYWTYGSRTNSVKHFKETFKELAKLTSADSSLQQESLFAWLYHEAGEVKLAQSVVDRAVKLGIDSGEDILFVNTQIGRGMLLNYLGKASEALLVYDEILEIGAGYAEINKAVIEHYKGRSLFFNKQYDEAIVALKPILEQAPDQGDYLEWVAMTYLAMGEIEQSKTVYERLLTLAPAYPSYNLGMAKVLLTQSEPIEAKSYLEKALEAWQHADMVFDDIVETQQLLESLQ